MSSVLLGHVTVPSGKLLILDPGLARSWRHDGDPDSPETDASANTDLRIVGPDAIEAGTKFDRQFDPRYLYDVSDVQSMMELFDKFIQQHSFNAQLQPATERISHLQRARLALECSGGLGIVPYGVWGVIVGDLPTDRKIPVFGEVIDEGIFQGRFRRINLEIDSDANVQRTETVEGVMVDHGLLICADLESFGEFRMGEPADGLADYVMQGHDDAVVAHVIDAPDVFEDGYGWKNIPMDQIDSVAEKVAAVASAKNYHISVDYRPHCNLEKLNSQIRQSETRSGEVELGDSLACGFKNRWGDGIFPVTCDFDVQEKLVRVSLDVGNEKHQQVMRQVMVRHQSAIVTKRVWEEGHAIQSADRLQPSHNGDSGWFFSSGTEDEAYLQDPGHFALLSVNEIIERDPTIEEIIDTKPGTQFHRDGDKFVEG